MRGPKPHASRLLLRQLHPSNPFPFSSYLHKDSYTLSDLFLNTSTPPSDYLLFISNMGQQKRKLESTPDTVGLPTPSPSVVGSRCSPDASTNLSKRRRVRMTAPVTPSRRSDRIKARLPDVRCHVNRMPTEILISIFTEVQKALKTQKYTLEPSVKTVCNLAHVCTRWRDVMINCPPHMVGAFLSPYISLCVFLLTSPDRAYIPYSMTDKMTQKWRYLKSRDQLLDRGHLPILSRSLKQESWPHSSSRESARKFSTST